MLKHFFTTILVLSLSSTSLFAMGNITSDQSVEKIMFPGYPQEKTYQYNSQSVKNIISKDSKLVEVICQSTQILQQLGLQKSTLAINTVGFTKDNLDMTVDIKNCSLYAGRSIRTQPTQGVGETQALQTAQQFITTILGQGGLISTPALGTPSVISKDGYNMYPMMEDTTLKSAATTTEHIDTTYSNITIMYPYMINNAPLYNNYGDMVGVTLTVDANGINSVSVPLLAFKSITKTAEKLSDTAMNNLISRGGNNPYYGERETVALQDAERVSVYFTYAAPNQAQRIFISDGIRLGSTIRRDQRSPQLYQIVVSDFVIGNINNYPMMKYDDSLSSETPPSTIKEAQPTKTIRKPKPRKRTPRLTRPKAQTTSGASYVGLTIDAAQALATTNEVPFRIIAQDDKLLPMTMDYRPGRINATVRDGLIVSVDVEGMESQQ